MKKLLLIIGCSLLLFFTACNKELSDNFITYPNNPLNDTAWVKNLTNTSSIHDLFDLLVPPFLIDSFNVANGGEIKWGDSVEIKFSPATLFLPGSTIIPIGNAKIEVTPLKRKGDFIRIFKPTTTNTGALLETGGGFFLKVSQNNNELKLVLDSTFELKFNDVDTPPKMNMQIFYGKEGFPVPAKGIDTTFFWIRDFDTSRLETWSKVSNNPLVPSFFGYKMKSKNLRWITADRYADSSQQRTKITAILSPNFTNKNTAVFAVFNNQKTVVNLKGDYPSRSFNTSNIPFGISMKLISLSKIGSQLYLGVKVISTGTVVTSYTIVPTEKSLKEIIDYLNSL